MAVLHLPITVGVTNYPAILEIWIEQHQFEPEIKLNAVREFTWNS